MHAIKGGWVGQPFALAMSKDSKERKSRTRRSKEERKDMVESFIKKYQISNNGHFPSLNLTHKEVGGSFYTVREIVREIIQENRVLAPPKMLVDEQSHSDFLEQYPLGSLSIEPETNSCVLVDVLNGTEVPEKDPKFDSVLIDAVPVDHRDTSKGTIPQSSQNFNGSGNLILNHEEYANDNSQIAYGEKAKEFKERTYTESIFMLMPDTVQEGAKEIEASQGVISHTNCNVLVEKFPLRPIIPISYDVDGKSDEVCQATKTLDKSTQQKKISSIQIPSEKYENEHQDLTLELSSEYTDEKVVVNIQSPSLESSSISSSVEACVVDVKDVEAKDSLPDKSKADDASDRLIYQDSISIHKKLSYQTETGLPKGNGPMLDRLKLAYETQEVESNKSNSRPENNPILALVKAFLSAFVKFWTE